MSREDEIIRRAEESVSNDGYLRKNIYTRLEFGMGNNTSYFQVLVDKKLEGAEYPTAQQVWEEMKMQLNFAQGVAAKASEEYLRLQNKVRDLEEHIKWLESRK